MRPPRGWMSDLALGVRLAVGGGRTSLARFALSAFGIAIAVTVLLVAASIGNMTAANHARSGSDSATYEVVPGLDPVYISPSWTEFRGESIDLSYVYAEGDNHAVPPTMDDLPGPGEMVVSPALAELLDSPEGELLKPRFDAEIVDIMAMEIVPEPQDLRAYVGADASLAESPDAFQTYQFGDGGDSSSIPAQLLVLVLIGVVALLTPVFIFVSSASRIAGSERDRRLSALRLVGSGSRQVRRIAAAESLVSAFAGLALGAGAFLVIRQYAERIELFDLGVYRRDVVPDPVLVGLIVLAIPALAVLTALFALRRTIIEPLGVVRLARPVRRRVWWRLALIVVGVALLATQGGASDGTTIWVMSVTAGAAMLLLGVPVLLPWLVERVAGRITGGPTSWQLAIRRLQLDSGTSARVVGGVAIVLAGAIALQTVMATVESDVGLDDTGQAEQVRSVEVSAEAGIIDDVAAELRSVPKVETTHLVRDVVAYDPESTPEEGGLTQYVAVMDCVAIRELVGIRDCADGQIFSVADSGPAIEPGMRLEFREYPPYTADYDPDDFERLGFWTVPDDVRKIPPVDRSQLYATTIATPGALTGAPMPDDLVSVFATVGDLTSDEVEQVRNSVAEFGWQTYVSSFNLGGDLTTGQENFVTLRNALYAGSIFTLLLAAVSLLVLALEHIRERRRPLAVLTASGVQQGVLARSLLWQVALPIGLGVLVAIVTGVGLAALLVALSEDVFSIDWSGVVLLSGGAALLSVLVTALTLPFLRSATRLTSLRTE